MNLKELIDELRANILRDTSDEVGARGVDLLWSDASLVRYINDGMNKFASETLLLRDETTPALTKITLVEGQDSYPLDKRVISVFGARMGDRVHLSRSTYGGLFSNRGDMTTGGVVRDYSTSNCPRFFYTDREEGKLGIWPAPGAEYADTVVTLRVARYPLQELQHKNLEAVPELPSQYHLDILEWAAWRALRNHDVDGAENMNKASAHKTRFTQAVAELKLQAKRLLAQDFQFDLRNNWGV